MALCFPLCVTGAATPPDESVADALASLASVCGRREPGTVLRASAMLVALVPSSRCVPGNS